MSSPVCVDASFVVRLLVPGPFSDEAESLFANWLREETTLIAPAPLTYEVLSAVRRLVHFKAVTSARGDEALFQFLRLDIRYSHRQAIWPLAWQFSQTFNRPVVYDAAYLAVAKLRGCNLWTADERLHNAVHDRLDWVQWVGAYRPAQ